MNTKHYRLRIAAIIIACFVTFSIQKSGVANMQTNPAPERSIEMQVWEVIKDFNRAFAANDPAKYFTYINDDITVITPSNPYRVEGINDDREEFEYGLRTGANRVAYFQEMQPKVQVFGDTAVVTYFSRGSYGPESQQKTFYFKETDVLVKKNGAWKIVHIHVSATP